MNVKESEIKSLLTQYKKFTVYGLSPDPQKPSHYVPVYMRNQGWEMVGTYPKPHSVDDFTIYPKLSAVPKEYRKFIDVFRAAEKLPELIDEILDLGGVEVLWLQLGISHPEAERRAEEVGIRVVSNHCLIPAHKKAFGK